MVPRQILNVSPTTYTNQLPLIYNKEGLEVSYYECHIFGVN